MISVQEIDEEFKGYVYAKYPELLESINLAVYKKGEKKGAQIDLNSPRIATLTSAFYKLYMMSPIPEQHTSLYNLVRQLAIEVNDDESLMQLRGIYNTTGKIGFPLAIVEHVVFRDARMASISLNKKYNFGRNSRPVRLGDLVNGLAYAKTRIMDIFHRICSEQDIPMPKIDFSTVTPELPPL